MSKLLSAHHLQKRYGGIVAIDNLTFLIDDRELVCVIGPNGAGKSTLLNLFCGITKPDAGEIVFIGEKLVGLPEYRFARFGIIRKFQVPTVFPNLSVRQNLVVAGDASAKPYTSAKVDRLLASLQLHNQADMTAASLAHGDRQRLELGLCLMCDPKLLLLDEPTAGLTSRETEQIALTIRELVSTTAIIVIEHDMSFVRRLSSRTCVMHQGRIIRDSSFSEIETDELVRTIYLGRE
jgi:ABC-type uncharacterized transport system ATPase subunit